MTKDNSEVPPASPKFVRPRRFAAVFGLILGCSILMPGGYGRAQESSPDAAQQLERLRREIQEAEQRIKQNRSKEQDLLGELENCDREIALRTELMQKLEQERKRTQISLDASRRELQSIGRNLLETRGDSQRTAADYDLLRDLVRRRAIYAYKYYRRDALKAVLTSNSVTQWLTRQVYLKRIAAADQANLQQLNRKGQELASLVGDLNHRHSAETERLEKYRQIAAYKGKLLSEEKAQSKTLKERRANRENLLKRVRQDRELLAQQLEEKKEAADRVASLITSLELKREKALPTPLPKAVAPEVPFSQLKGRMTWPAVGEIVARFGLQKHERLATVTENPGIDIAADEGSSVNAVCAGQITKITWLRGYGSTVIVDHADGYYTVYAHLGEIQVREGQNVKTGETIGRVGESGSLSGPRLHFEIWAKRIKQDPLLWLAGK